MEYPQQPRPTRQNFVSYHNGTSSRFDHTFNGDYWGANTIMGVKGVQGLQGLPAWKNASSATVHMCAAASVASPRHTP